MINHILNNIGNHSEKYRQSLINDLMEAPKRTLVDKFNFIVHVLKRFWDLWVTFVEDIPVKLNEQQVIQNLITCQNLSHNNTVVWWKLKWIIQSYYSEIKELWDLNLDLIPWVLDWTIPVKDFLYKEWYKELEVFSEEKKTTPSFMNDFLFIWLSWKTYIWKWTSWINKLKLAEAIDIAKWYVEKNEDWEYNKMFKFLLDPANTEFIMKTAWNTRVAYLSVLYRFVWISESPLYITIKNEMQR